MKFQKFILLSILTFLFLQLPSLGLAQQDSSPKMCHAVFYYLNHKMPMDLQKVRQNYQQGLSIDKATDASWAHSENAEVPSFREYIEIAFEQDLNLKKSAEVYFELQKRSQSVRYKKFWNSWRKYSLPMGSKMKSKLDRANSSNFIVEYIQWSIENADEHLKNIAPSHLREAAVIYVLAEIQLILQQQDRSFDQVQKIVENIYQKTHGKKKSFIDKLVEDSKNFEYRRDAYLQDLSQIWERESKIVWEEVKKEIGSDLVGDDLLVMTIGSKLKKGAFFNWFSANLIHAPTIQQMESLYFQYHKMIPMIVHSSVSTPKELLEQ